MPVAGRDREETMCVPNGVLDVVVAEVDVLVAEVVLQGLRVLAVIGEFETAGSALRSLAHAHRGCCRARRGALRTIHRAARADQRD